MKNAIDSAGRIVIPKAVRDAAGITPSTPLLLRFRDGRIEIEVAPLAVELEDEGGVVVARPKAAVPALGADEVERVRDRLRDERG